MRKRRKFRMARLPTGERVRVRWLNGRRGFVVRFPDTCSGCYAGYEYGGDGYWGNGCHECGYVGWRHAT